MTNPTPEALARLRQVASAETGSGRMFTLDDAVEIVAYIDRLEAHIPSARITGDKGWENPAEGAHPTSEPLPDAGAAAIERGDHRGTDGSAAA